MIMWPPFLVDDPSMVRDFPEGKTAMLSQFGNVIEGLLSEFAQEAERSSSTSTAETTSSTTRNLWDFF